MDPSCATRRLEKGKSAAESPAGFLGGGLRSDFGAGTGADHLSHQQSDRWGRDRRNGAAALVAAIPIPTVDSAANATIGASWRAAVADVSSRGGQRRGVCTGRFLADVSDSSGSSE